MSIFYLNNQKFEISTKFLNICTEGFNNITLTVHGYLDIPSMRDNISFYV